MLAASNGGPAPVKSARPPLFTFEALAVFAFGVSWFVKGNALQSLASVPAPAHAGCASVRRSAAARAMVDSPRQGGLATG